MQLGLTCQAGAGSPSALHSDGVCSQQPKPGGSCLAGWARRCFWHPTAMHRLRLVDAPVENTKTLPPVWSRDLSWPMALTVNNPWKSSHHTHFWPVFSETKANRPRLGQAPCTLFGIRRSPVAILQIHVPARSSAKP